MADEKNPGQVEVALVPPTFDELLPEDLSPKRLVMVGRFLRESADQAQLTVDEIKTKAAENFNAFFDAFETWEKGDEGPETERQQLKVYFRPDEREKLASTLARGISKLADLKEELDTIKADYKGRMTALEAEVAASARSLNVGYTMQPVEVRVLRDYEKKEVLYYRMDTEPEEFVSGRPMTRTELQRRLDRIRQDEIQKEELAKLAEKEKLARDQEAEKDAGE